MTRGQKECVDNFIKQLEAQYLPLKADKRDIKDSGDGLVQLGVRPIQLWEIVFPKEMKDIVLNSIFEGEDGHTQQKKHKKFVSMIRKVLGIQPMPKEYDKTKKFITRGDHIEKIGIGIKEDYTMEHGTEGL